MVKETAKLKTINSDFHLIQTFSQYPNSNYV